MKTTIPEELKSDLPHSIWGKILGGTPVVLAVVSTMLAGLASSEMTTAQYDRSLAAQLQSKAGDQWGFFQAKRLRSALQNGTLDVIVTTNGMRAIDRTALAAAVASTPAAAVLESPAGQQAFTALTERAPPKPPAAAPLDPSIEAALAAIEAARPDPEIAARIAVLKDPILEGTVRAARDRAAAMDAQLTPINQAIDALEREVNRPQTDAALRSAFILSRLAYNGRRYDAEARLNQGIGLLCELQVRRANMSAERHHRRSQKFFYGMLAAQTGVIVATLAIAARKRNLLWSFAAAAGMAAIAFALYVYLYV